MDEVPRAATGERVREQSSSRPLNAVCTASEETLLQWLSLAPCGSDVPAAPLSWGGEGRELHRAPPIREPRCSDGPRLALRLNKLYPETFIFLLVSLHPWWGLSLLPHRQTLNSQVCCFIFILLKTVSGGSHSAFAVCLQRGWGCDADDNIHTLNLATVWHSCPLNQ